MSKHCGACELEPRIPERRADILPRKTESCDYPICHVECDASSNAIEYAAKQRTTESQLLSVLMFFLSDVTVDTCYCYSDRSNLRPKWQLDIVQGISKGWPCLNRHENWQVIKVTLVT